jgi:hypothetical protein
MGGAAVALAGRLGRLLQLSLPFHARPLLERRSLIDMANWWGMGSLEPLEFFSERSCFPPLRSGNLDLDKRPSLEGVRVLPGCDPELCAHLPGLSLSNRHPRRSGFGYFHCDLVPKASFTSSRLSTFGLRTLCFSIFLCGCIRRELPGLALFLPLKRPPAGRLARLMVRE